MNGVDDHAFALPRCLSARCSLSSSPPSSSTSRIFDFKVTELAQDRVEIRKEIQTCQSNDEVYVV